jgi:ABC-type phosphate/phosphonate transport system substrate-binding protein
MVNVLLTILAALLSLVSVLLLLIFTRDAKWHEEVRQEFIETRKNFQKQFDCVKTLLNSKVGREELEKFAADNSAAHVDLWKRLYGHYHNAGGDVSVPKERS